MKSKFIFSFIITIALSFSLFGQIQSPKIDPVILQKLVLYEKTDVIILFKTDNDFTTKNSIHGKESKGRFVFQKLQQRMNENRETVINYLKNEDVKFQEFYIINGLKTTLNQAQLSQLSQFKNVKAIIHDSEYSMLEPVDERNKITNRTIEWGVDMINAPDVWALGYKGAGVVIAGQDTGYKWDHAALKEKYRGWNGSSASHDYNWHDAIHSNAGTNPCGADSAFPCDDHNHGTHTMGTMIGDDNMGNQIGVAPDAKWIGCRNMDQGVGTLSTYLECFEFLLAPYAIGQTPANGDPSKAPHVINNSWACPPSEGCNISNWEPMREAIENLKNAGVVVVVSAGNSGSACSTVSDPPAIFEESFSVGSTTSSDIISSFSSRGPVTIDGSNRLKPNVSAPGSAVRSSVKNGGYATYSGTSMAGPHVAGAVALIISANPDLAGEVEMIEDILEQSTVHLSTTQTCGGLNGNDTPNNTYGYGRIDALAAVNLALNPNFVKTIKIDHFGYRTNDQKIAVLSNPQVGYNSADVYSPSSLIKLKDANTHLTVFSAAPLIWNGGATHNASGDQVWWFDFSNFSTPGTYYVADGAIRSEDFQIQDNVYHQVLDLALKSFYYQRCGVEKSSSFVGNAYADGVCHSQDMNCKFINDLNNTALEKDMSGGWHDAGDYNKYVNFTGGTLHDLLLAFEINQESWTDQTGIPESGNGIPDILDEIKVELDWLMKMQDTDGGVYSLVGVQNFATDSPPSADNATRYYGPKTTSASLTVSAVFALAAIQFSKINNAVFQSFATDLTNRAKIAWNWAVANPNISYYNSGIIAAGEQELSTYERDMRKLVAAIYLYALTSDSTYKTYVESNYTNSHMMQWTFVYPFENMTQIALLYYAHIDGITATVGSDIKDTFKLSMDNHPDNMPSFTNKTDAYLAHIADNNYVWGSNKVKTDMGNLYQIYQYFGLDPVLNDDLENYASAYLHYIHGVNPNDYTYLSNMFDYGASKSCRSIYHGWFTDGSADWDDAFVSTYGPAPGFVPGGPNPNWGLDGCCPSACGSYNSECVSLVPPDNQPPMKSYLDWNTGWPQNSWEITEPAIYSQASYLALLSTVVNQNANLTDGKSAVIVDDKDFVFNTLNRSVILQSENGMKYRIIADNTGKLSTEIVNTLNPNTCKVINGSLVIDQNQFGIVIKSPDSNDWRIKVDKNGKIFTENITLPASTLSLDNQDLLVDIFPNGLILRDEENVCYKITVNDAGKLFCNASKCGQE